MVELKMMEEKIGLVVGLIICNFVKEFRDGRWLLLTELYYAGIFLVPSSNETMNRACVLRQCYC